MSEERANVYLIITTGATGSGKTRLMQETIAMLGIDPQTVIKLLVDDLVEHNEKYRQKVESIMHTIENLCATEESKTACEKQKYEHPSPELLKQFSDSYFSVRSAPGCISDFPELNCNEVNDMFLENAVRNRNNIVFEFTGYYIPSWLLDTSRIHNVYQIVFAYSFVTASKLVERNTARAYKTIQDFKQNRSGPAPRLPDVSLKTLKRTVLNLRCVLKQLYTDCIFYYNPAICGNKRIDRLILFDNNGLSTSFRKVYDSMEQGKLPIETFLDIVDESLDLA